MWVGTPSFGVVAPTMRQPAPLGGARVAEIYGAGRIGGPRHVGDPRPTCAGHTDPLASGAMTDLFDGYPPGAAWDEVIDPDGGVRPAYRHVHAALARMSGDLQKLVTQFRY